MKILGKIFVFISMGLVTTMLHFIVLTMIIENRSTATMVDFCILYPITLFITYIYIAIIIDEVKEV